MRLALRIFAISKLVEHLLFGFLRTQIPWFTGFHMVMNLQIYLGLACILAVSSAWKHSPLRTGDVSTSL